MSECPVCGCSTSENETYCPACFTSLGRKSIDLTWAEMERRLIAAGWTKAEAAQEIHDMQNETESGM